MAPVKDYKLSKIQYNPGLTRNYTIETTRNLQSNADETDCLLHTLLQFTRKASNDSLFVREGIIETYERAAAIALAANHLNAGNWSLIQDIKGLNGSCPLNFTLRFSDTEGQAGIALDQIYEAIKGPYARPCSFIGATFSAVTEATSILTGFEGHVQVSGDSTSPTLNDRDQFINFARTIPSDGSNVRYFLEYLNVVLGVKYLAILNSNTDYGNMYAQAMREANRALNLNMILYQRLVDIQPPPPSSGIHATTLNPLEEVIKDLKDSGFTYIYCIISPSDSDAIGDFDKLLEEAYNQGIAGPDSKRTWLFSDTFEENQLLNRIFSSDEILAKAYQGVGRLEVASNAQALSGRELYNQFEQQISQLLPANKDYFRSIFPPITNKDGSSEVPFLDDPTFLQPPLSSNIPFLYEAAISLGLSACNALNNTQRRQSGKNWGKSHYDELLKLDFIGISGDVRFNGEGTRLSDTVLYSVTNFQAAEIEGSESLIQFKSILTNLEENEQWNQKDIYIYADGTSTVPSDTLPPKLFGLSLGWVIVSLLMCGILCTLSVGFAIWTFVHRKSHVVKASQPIFLSILCSGVMMMSLSIIPFTMPTTAGCNISIWFINIGIAMTFSAIFAKTWRINKIMNSGQKFIRVKVTVLDAAIPMICLLGANILILTCMTILSPESLELVITSEDNYGRPVQGFQRCDAEDRNWYYVALGLINASVICGAIYQSWRARNLSLEYSESKYIFKALQVTVVVIFVAIPLVILAIMQGNGNIALFASSAIIFVFGCSTLFLIFIPKIKALNMKRRTKVRITGVRRDSSSEVASGIKILNDLSPEEMVIKIKRLESDLQEAEAKLRIESAKVMSNGVNCNQAIEREALLEDRNEHNNSLIENSTDGIHGDDDTNTKASKCQSILVGNVDV